MRHGSTSDFTESLEYVYYVKMGVVTGTSFVIFGVFFIVKLYGDLLSESLGAVYFPA